MTIPGEMIGSVMRSTAHSGWAPWMIAARSRLTSALRRLAPGLMTTNGMPLTPPGEGRGGRADRRRHQRAKDKRAEQRLRRNDVTRERKCRGNAEQDGDQRRQAADL